MNSKRVLKDLRSVQEKYKDVITHTGQIRISDMAKDAADTIQLLTNQVEFLWGLLDDIDTVGDMAKDNDKVYRTMVEKIHLKRQQVAESNGYKIFIKDRPPVKE